jgi:hypothetical protein
MTRGMRVAVLPGDTGACGHYRLIWPGDAVSRLDEGWSVRVYDPRRVKLTRSRHGTLRVEGLDWRNIDVLVTQRVGSPLMAELTRWLQKRGVAVVMDMDDAMWCLDPRNVAYRGWNDHGTSPGRVHWSVIDEVAETVDLVTVTTQVLADRYGAHGRVEILPNRVPRMALRTPRRPRSGRPVVGWSGLLSTHPQDPYAVGDAVATVAAAGLVDVAVMGDPYRVGKMWGTRVSPIAVASLGPDYYRQLARFDVGLVPLDLHGTSGEFNTGKSSLKALEFAATGAAVIASPTPANLELAEEVPIRLAATPAEWLGHLYELAEPETRAEQVEKQRTAIESCGWVLQDRARDWSAAWSLAVENRRR